MVPMDASFFEQLLMERAPRRQSMDLLKRVKPIKFFLLYVITSENESFLLLIQETNLCMAFEADRLAPSVHEKIKIQVAISTSIFLFARISAA